MRARHRLRFAAACALVLGAGRAPAASALDFDVWMRAIDARSVAVQKHIAAGDAAAAAADARELERLYAFTQDWFARDSGAADAAALAADGKALAAAIPGALAAGDLDRAALSARTLAKACNDCHDNYKPFK
jgi:hypothetical protein